MKVLIWALSLVVSCYFLTSCRSSSLGKNLNKYQEYKKVQRANDEDAVLLATRAPQYPYQAAKNGIEGYVRFSFDILPDGTPFNIRIVESVPEKVFDKEALKAIKKWKFKGKVINGEPVIQTDMRYVLNFRLS